MRPTQVIEGQKKCSRCGVLKSLWEFNRCNKASNGRQGNCRECSRDVGKLATTRRRASEYYQENKEANFFTRIRRVFKLSVEQWDEMMLKQGGMCAICDEESKLGVDHDHVTGNVRALLCNQCNSAIGLLNESPTTIRKAAGYIESFR